MWIEITRNCLRTSHSIKSVTEVEAVTDLSIEERPRAHHIAPASQVLSFGIPERKRVVSDKVGDPFFTPPMPRAENQLLIGYFSFEFIAVLFEFAPQIV